MAKSKAVTYKASFSTDKSLIQIEHIRFVRLPLPLDGRKFMHLEKKGNQWLMLHTDGMLFDGEAETVVIDIMRDVESKGAYMPNFLANERPLPISRYTAISTINKSEFYHLDELDDGTYRITHGLGFLTGLKWVPPKDKYNEHKYLNQIVLEACNAD